jgi:hypothetical protein
MNFTFSMDNYYLIGAIALALILITVGAFMYIRNRSAPAEETAPSAEQVYQEVAGEEPPQPEPAHPSSEEEHAHVE